MTVKCYVFSRSTATRHVTVMSAYDGWSSVCTESVRSTMFHCARVALVITLGSGAHVERVEQLNEHHLIHARRNNNRTQHVFRALDVLASKCRHACTSNHAGDHGFVY